MRLAGGEPSTSLGKDGSRYVCLAAVPPFGSLSKYWRLRSMECGNPSDPDAPFQSYPSG